jgi:hypothetical protein
VAGASPPLAKPAIIACLAAVALAPMNLHAETVAHPAAGAPASSNARAQLTGKERLGEKWKDEQRVDSCKVLPDEQGPKPRPDGCWGALFRTALSRLPRLELATRPWPAYENRNGETRNNRS